MLAERFIAALESDLPCEFQEAGPEVWTGLLPGSQTLLRIDEGRATLTVSTPVDGAHDGLPADDLRDLLRFNFPNDVTRSSFLASGRAAGLIELVDAIPLSNLAPADAARNVFDQIAASLLIARHLASRRGARLAIRGS